MTAPRASGARDGRAAPHVVVVGDVMTDVIAMLSAPLTTGTDTPARIVSSGGGQAGNVAAWLAEADASVDVVARVGADAFGLAAAEALRLAGARPLLAVDPLRPTGTCVVLVDLAGERTMVPDRGANAALAVADLAAARWTSGAHLHLSGYCLLDEGSRPAALAALARARVAGMTASVDPASASLLSAMGVSRFLAAVRGVDVLLPNSTEACLLAGTADARAAAVELSAHVGTAVVTCGADGALAASRGDVVSVPAEPSGVVDTTGAGDAFSAGFLMAWLRGAALGEALSEGTRTATRSVGTLGGRPAL